MFILERLTEIIAPFCCLQCGYEGSVVCEPCAGMYCRRLPPRCYRCVSPSKNFAVCQSCAQKTLLRQVWIATRLKGLPETLIHTFKFERAQAAAPRIAEIMSQRLPRLPKDTIVVPIPPATTRMRQRGYDHAALLAQAVARQRGYSYQKALRRLGQSRQVGATRPQRLAQLKGAFRVTGSDSLAGAYIVLVDDVVTTGATIEEAARVLRKAGAKRIDALVFAQK